MPSDTITLALTGDVSLEDFATAIGKFKRLVLALTQDVSKGRRVEWLVHDLQVGSAVATIRGEAESLDSVERVVHAYASVGQALERGGSLASFSAPVIRGARSLTRVLSNRVTSIRFETPEEDATIANADLMALPGAQRVPTSRIARGAVEGMVQTLSNRKGLRFVLYDTLHDRAVSCYLGEDQEEVMRGAWGQRAMVEGEVSRHILSGNPVAIRHIAKVEVMPRIERGSYLRARGVSPLRPGDPKPEETIRRLRDA